VVFAAYSFGSDRRRIRRAGGHLPAGNIMSRVLAALSAVTLAALSLPTTASAGCYNCYAPPQPCVTCYQQQVVPPQYRTINQTVMVAPGRMVAHRTPAQYQTVMVPRTVMVAPPSVQYEQIPAQYATSRPRRPMWFRWRRAAAAVAGKLQVLLPHVRRPGLAPGLFAWEPAAAAGAG
jgi:hypothetical protein